MKTAALAVVLLLAPVFTVPAHAQEMAGKSAPKTLTTSQALLESWNDIGRKLIAMAEDFPEDKYDFKATPAERTFAENLLHAANANYYFINVANSEKPPAEENPSRAQYETKADVVAFVKKAFADGAATIKAKGDKGLAAYVIEPFSHERMRLSDLAYGYVEHSGEHYGQLVVYYRLSGLVPPESRPKK